MGITKLPKTGRKGGPLTKLRRTNIKKKILKTIEEGMFSDINNNKLAFARDNNINRDTLKKLLEEIIPDLNSIPQEILKVDILALYERMKRRILFWWDKCEAAPMEEQSFELEKQVFKEMREVLKDFRETCIQLGVIEKIADKVEITADFSLIRTDSIRKRAKEMIIEADAGE